MKERPILFSGPMVRAILDGRKSQARRIVKPQPEWHEGRAGAEHFGWKRPASSCYVVNETPPPCPYGVPGDRLWVREAWQAFFADEVPEDRPRGPRHTMGIPARPERESFVFYRADGELEHPEHGAARWRSPIHLPRRFSRITLEIVNVRAERLVDISQSDCIAESCPGGIGRDPTPRQQYRELWESINGPGSWDANPWVWVIEFRREA